MKKDQINGKEEYKMIYIKTNSEGLVTLQHNFPFHPRFGLGKTEEELLQEGFLVDGVPLPEYADDKNPILYYKDGVFNYVYEEIAIQKTDMEIMQEENLALKNSLADLWEVVLLGGM